VSAEIAQFVAELEGHAQVLEPGGHKMRLGNSRFGEFCCGNWPAHAPHNERPQPA
jgi:hypothetical protein